MQNQLQHSISLGSAIPQVGSPKFATHNYIKTFDKTLPTNSIKHYSSNPNLSLETNHSKPTNYQPVDYSSHNHPKNIDFRNQVNSPTFMTNGSQASTRPSRS